MFTFETGRVFNFVYCVGMNGKKQQSIQLACEKGIRSNINKSGRQNIPCGLKRSLHNVLITVV